MSSPVGDPSALAEDDLLGDDWFGDGSPFESGEKLAAALLTLVAAGDGGGVRAVRVTLPAEAEPDAATPPRGAELAPLASDRAADLLGEFQVAAMPSFRPRDPAPAGGSELGSTGWRHSPPPQPQAQRTGWTIRQSVQMLRMTEEILRQVRVEAAELAWRWAAAAHEDVDG